MKCINWGYCFELSIKLMFLVKQCADVATGNQLSCHNRKAEMEARAACGVLLEDPFKQCHSTVSLHQRIA